MIKKYVIYQLKQWLPYLILLFVLMASICWITSLNMDMEISLYPANNGTEWKTYASSTTLMSYTQVMEFGIVGMVCACLVPFLVYHYRFSTKRADTFYQLPFEEKQFRRIRMILGLVAFLIMFTVVMWVSVTILAINASKVVETTYIRSDDIYKSARVNLNYLYYLPTYLLLLIFISIEYLSSCYIVSQCNNLLDSILQLLLYQLALLLIFYVPFHFFGLSRTFSSNVGIDELDLSMATAICFIYNFFGSLIAGCSGFATSAEIGYLVTCFILYCLLHITMAFFALWEKEPSGEYSGKAGSRNIPMKILPHVSYALIGMWMMVDLSYSISVFLILDYIIFMLGYYVMLALLKRNIRLDKKTLIIFLSVSLGLCAFNSLYLTLGLPTRY